MTLDDFSSYKKAAKNGQLNCCKQCDYNTSELSKYNRHLLTSKHKKMTEELHLGANKEEKAEGEQKFLCICGSSYKYRQGLFKHKKKCNLISCDSKDKTEICDKDLIITLLKQNAELLEIIKNGTNNNSNNNSNNTNSNNKTFNLQFFLNETCKDAMKPHPQPTIHHTSNRTKDLTSGRPVSEE